MGIRLGIGGLKIGQRGSASGGGIPPFDWSSYWATQGILNFNQITGDDLRSIFTASTWDIVNDKAVNQLSLDVEKCTDPGFEGWTNDTTPSIWGKYISGSTTINREDVIITEGSHAVRFDLDAVNSDAYVILNPFLTVGKKYKITGYARSDSGTPILKFSSSFVYSNTVNTAYTKYHAVLAAGAGYFVVNPSGANRSVYVDNISVKEILNQGEFCLYDSTKKDGYWGAKLSVIQIGMGGVVCCADDLVTPTSYVVAYIDKALSSIVVKKYVSGAPTLILSSLINYVDDAFISIKKSGNSFWFFYGGVQVSDVFTISDAEIVNNTIHGLFADDVTTNFSKYISKDIGVGAVLLTFDDAFVSQYTEAFDYMKGKINGTVYVSTNYIDDVVNPVPDAVMMTHQNLQEMYAEGWDMANHTKEHPDLRTLSQAQQAVMISEAINALNGWGLTRASLHFAFPYGVYNADTMIALASCGIKTARLCEVINNNMLGDSQFSKYYLLPTVIMTDAAMTLVNFQTAVNKALASGSICVFYTHKILVGAAGEDTDRDVFRSCIDWLVAENITTMTITQLYELIK